jgi:hypothetical protein
MTNNVEPEEIHDSSKMPHGELRCGDDAEESARREIDAAKADEAKADEEIKHGLHDREEAEQQLEKAEADLEDARRRSHVIHFNVDGEEFETKQREWTPNQIIKDFGERDPATNYLVEIEGHSKKSFEGKGTVPIELHDCERFQIVSTGPTPVADGSDLVGMELFVAGLRKLGYSPQIVNNKPDHVVFAYTVATGKYAGKQVRLGLVVPGDFPMTPPGGLHVSPRIHPNKDGQVHPTEGIRESPDFQSKAGGEWQYWSRPFKEWGKVKKTVATYMSHLWQLWDSQ